MKKLIVFMFSIVLLGSCSKENENIPVLSTVPVDYYKDGISYTAESGGVITSDGGQEVTIRGICWSTSPNPTLLNDTTINGNGTGNFSSIIDRLEGNTTYYIKSYATNSNGTGYGEEFSFTTPSLSIGDYYQGGIVFYFDGNGGGLISAESSSENQFPPSSLSTGGYIWGCYGTELTGADGTIIGTGYQNTLDILAGCSVDLTAANICANFNYNNFNDWYLPSKDELLLMYQNIGQGNLLGLGNIGGFSTDGGYWSSSEYDNNQAWYKYFGVIQGPFEIDKSGTLNVRAIRTF